MSQHSFYINILIYITKVTILYYIIISLDSCLTVRNWIYLIFLTPHSREA